jgi:hypothetical protein
MATTPTTTHGSVDPMRKTALAAGLLYLATFVFSIPALGIYDNVVNNPDFVLGAGSDDGVLWGALIEVITALAGIGTAVVLYSVVKRYGRAGALGFVASRVLEASMIFVGVVAVLSVFTLRQDVAGADATGAVAGARALVAIKDWTFLLGPGLMAVVNALCLATVLYRSRLVPRIIPTIGLVGAPILLGSFVATLFGVYDQVSTPALFAALPIAVWEFSLGVWLTVKGFTDSTSTDRSRSTSEPAVAVATA